MTDNDLAFAPAMELRRLIAGKQVSPVEITELYLSRIEELDSKLNSYLLLTREEAMRTIKTGGVGPSTGPLSNR